MGVQDDFDEKGEPIEATAAAHGGGKKSAVVEEGFSAEELLKLSAAAAQASQAKPKVEKSKYTKELFKQVLKNCPKEIKEIITLRKAKKYYKSRNKALLVGPSGTGKTTIAEAITDACDMPCEFVSAPFLSNKYKNGGEENLKLIFARVKNNQPCALIIDELEAILNKHDQQNTGDQNLLRALWTILDQCDQLQILVIVTTNYIKELPGQIVTRFPAIYKIDLPDYEQRKDILQFHIDQAKEINDDNFDAGLEDHLRYSVKKLFTGNLITKTKNLSHRQIAHIVDEASIAAFLRASKTKNKSSIMVQDLYDAIPIVLKSHESIKDPNAESAWLKVLKEDPKFIINTSLYIAAGVTGTIIALKTLDMQKQMNLFSRILALLNYQVSLNSLGDKATGLVSGKGLLQLLEKLGFTAADLGNLTWNKS